MALYSCSGLAASLLSLHKVWCRDDHATGVPEFAL